MEENNLNQDLKKDGYSKEEKYFHDLNAELTKKFKRAQKIVSDAAEKKSGENSIERWESEGGALKKKKH